MDEWADWRTDLYIFMMIPGAKTYFFKKQKKKEKKRRARGWMDGWTNGRTDGDILKMESVWTI